MIFLSLFIVPITIAIVSFIFLKGISLYKQIQQVIEAGRNNFEMNQKMLIDKKQTYEVYLKLFPNSIFVSVLGFPKVDLNKYAIVTSDVTEKAFEEKKADYFKIR